MGLGFTGYLVRPERWGALPGDWTTVFGREALTPEDLALLRYDRHFRLSPGVKAVVGRDETENAVLSGFASGRWVITFPALPGPVALVEEDPSPEELELTAALAARHSDARTGEPVLVRASRDGETTELTVAPLSPDDPRIGRSMLGE